MAMSQDLLWGLRCVCVCVFVYYTVLDMVMKICGCLAPYVNSERERYNERQQCVSKGRETLHLLEPDQGKLVLCIG